jgi:CubicO group peptidase (beta-lactamase class C family)
VFPPEEVTSYAGVPETDPREVGLTPEGVAEIWRSVVRLYETGLHPAIALCMRRRGRVVLDRAIGHARGNGPFDPPDLPKVQATPRTLFTLYSASKAVTAMLVHLLDERGALHLDDPVVEYLPEFGRHGKEWITLRHILTHRAGIPAVGGVRIDADLLQDHPRILEILCEAKPTSVPGRRLAYHALSGGYVISAVIERVTGRDIRSFLRSEVLDPLGFDTLGYGVPPARIRDVAENVFTGPPTMPWLGFLLRRSLGLGLRDAIELSNDPRFLTAVIPSGNIIGTAEEGSRFFQLLLDGGEQGGVRIFDRRTVRRAVAEQSYLEVDSMLGLPVRYGMGFMLGARWFSLYGHNTPHAFGHVGFTNIMAYADPDRDVSVCLMTSGKPFITLDQIAWLRVARTIARVAPRVGSAGG